MTNCMNVSIHVCMNECVCTNDYILNECNYVCIRFDSVTLCECVTDRS